MIKWAGLSLCLLLLLTALIWNSDSLSQPIVNKLLNTEFVRSFAFLELDPKLGWRNRPSSSGYWPPLELASENVLDARGEVIPRFQPDATSIKAFLIDSDRYRTFYEIEQNGMRKSAEGYAPESDSASLGEIWILGDSTPFGFGISNRHSFAELLRPQLATFGLALRNYSVIGYSSRATRKQLEQLLRSSKSPPLAILVWVGFNDTSISQQGLWYWPLLPSVLTRIHYSREIRKISALSQSIHAPLFIFTLPILGGHEQIDIVNSINHELSESDRNVVLINVASKFHAINRRDLYAPIDILFGHAFHPSEEGHRIIFEQLLPKALERLNLRPRF